MIVSLTPHPPHLSLSPPGPPNAAWSFATLGLMPGAVTRAALEVAVVRAGPGMKPQHAANTAWSFATLGQTPSAQARTALEAAILRGALGMNSQQVANTVFAYATLGLMPGAEAWAALEAAAVRVGPSMNAQGISNTTWSFLILAATRGLPLPACYPSLWRAACGLDVASLKDVGIRKVFHAYLIHTELVCGDVRDEVTFPPWIMREAREAWMRQARDDATVSGYHKEIASIIGELGVPHMVERLTGDGYFSVDVYMPNHGVVHEIDGPCHFMNAPDGSDGAALGDAPRNTTRTPRMELRDKFLKSCHRAVPSIPYFEYDTLKGHAERMRYVAEKLRDAGVHVPASAAAAAAAAAAFI